MIKRKGLTLFLACLVFPAFGQEADNAKMIELGKAYKDFMFRTDASKSFINDLKAVVPENLKTANDFIIQTITSKNKLLTTSFLSRPDDKVLKNIFIIEAISNNLREENQVDNKKLVDSLSGKEIPTYELVDNYYGMLFTAVGNKNQPFDLSKTDFKMKDYNFKDDTEKGIMFLRCMDHCFSVIWGYMNIVKPANTKEAFKNIEKFPKFNGQPYYTFSDLYFPDFEMVIVEDKGKQSYKGYYINKYYELLLSHLTCLERGGAKEKETNDLLLGSILKESNLYKYTKHKTVLESIFREQKKD